MLYQGSKVGFGEKPSKGFYTIQLFGIVTQGIGAITERLATFKAAWEPWQQGRLSDNQFIGPNSHFNHKLMVI